MWRELNYALDVNCKIIDACMHLHTFIVDDFEIFNDDCRCFYAVNPFNDNEGVNGGEEDIHHNEDGSTLMGG